MGTLNSDYRLILYTCWTYFFTNMELFFSYYQLILIPLWPVLWDYKVPIFEVPIMGTFTNSDATNSHQAYCIAQAIVMRLDEHQRWVDIIHFCKINALTAEDIVPIILRDLPYSYWPERVKRRIQR